MSDNKKEENSRFKFFWIEITFTKEKKWEKVIWISLALIALIVILYLLKVYVMPAVITERILRVKISAIISLIKSRSP